MRSKYRIFTNDVWFDFDGPEFLIGAACKKEAIDTKFMFFWYYQN